MKSNRLADTGALKNELSKTRKGRTLDIRRFNQAARLARLGRIHELDAEQGEWLEQILRQGFEARANELPALERREFCLQHFLRAHWGET